MRIKGHGVTINTCNLRPKSIGSVTLTSPDPMVDPAIDPAFLQDPYDWLSMGASRGAEILHAGPFRSDPQGTASRHRHQTPGDPGAYQAVVGIPGGLQMGQQGRGDTQLRVTACRGCGDRRVDHADAHQR
jgi:hypothetical protein